MTTHAVTEAITDAAVNKTHRFVYSEQAALSILNQPLPSGSVAFCLWQDRSSCCSLNMGHLALAIAVPQDWYQHQVVGGLSDIPDQEQRRQGGAYYLYRDSHQHWQVVITHLQGVSESVDLTMAFNQLSDPDSILFFDNYPAHIGHFQGRFPEALVDCIAAFCQFTHTDNTLYISFGPEMTITSWSQFRDTAGRFGDKRIEAAPKESGPASYGTPDETAVLFGLDHVTLFQAGMRLKQLFYRDRAAMIEREEHDLSDEEEAGHPPAPSSRGLRYGIADGNHTCASTALSLLESCYVDHNIPGFSRFGQLEHILLLPLRPTFCIAALMPLYYDIIRSKDTILYKVLNEEKDGMMTDALGETFNEPLIATTLCASIVLFYLLEKHIHRVFSPLKNTTGRDRTLIEIHRTVDPLVQLCSFMAVSVVGIVTPLDLLTQLAWDTPSQHLLTVLDVGLFTLISIAGYVTAAMGISQFLDLFQGWLVKTPRYVFERARNLQAVDTIPADLLALQFKKEKQLGILMFTSLVINAAMLRYGDHATDGHDNDMLYLSYLFVSFLYSYVGTKNAIHLLDNHQRALMSTQALPTDNEQLAAFFSHDPKPGLFASTAFLSGTAMLVTADLLTPEMGALALTLTTIGVGLLSYIITTLMYHSYVSCNASGFSEGLSSCCSCLFSKAQQPEQDPGLLADNDDNNFQQAL